MPLPLVPPPIPLAPSLIDQPMVPPQGSVPSAPSAPISSLLVPPAFPGVPLEASREEGGQSSSSAAHEEEEQVDITEGELPPSGGKKKGAKRKLEDGQEYEKKKSAYKGVTWHKTDRRWQAAIKILGKSKHLGQFHDEAEAARKYDSEAVLIGRATNFPRTDGPLPPGAEEQPRAVKPRAKKTDTALQLAGITFVSNLAPSLPFEAAHSVYMAVPTVGPPPVPPREPSPMPLPPPPGLVQSSLTVPTAPSLVSNPPSLTVPTFPGLTALDRFSAEADQLTLSAEANAALLDDDNG